MQAHNNAHTGNRTPVTSMEGLYDATTLSVRLHHTFTEEKRDPRSFCGEEAGRIFVYDIGAGVGVCVCAGYSSVLFWMKWLQINVNIAIW